MSAPGRGVALAILGVQALLAAGLAWASLERINPDAVGYLGAARHLIEGRVGLAVTGSWGPLYSWLLAPLLALGLDPLAAARAVLVGAGLVHTAGLVRLVAALGLAGTWTGPLVAAGALHAAAWAGAPITADPLLAAALVWTVVGLVEDQGRGGAGPAVGALALALAKPIGLPLGLCLLGGDGLLRVLAGGPDRCAATRGPLRRLALAALLLSPWLAALSWVHGRPTTGGSGALNLAVSAPGLPTPIHAFPTFRGPHRPAPDRLSSWEDPAALPPAPWDPWATPADRAHLAGLVRANLGATAFHLWVFDWSGLLLVSLVVVPVLALVAPRPGAGPADAVLGLPALALGVGYLPFALHSIRYEWPLVGVGLAASGTLLARLGAGEVPEHGPARRLVPALVRVLGLGGPALASLVAFGFAASTRSGQAGDARELAGLAARAAVRGGIVSCGPGPHQPTVATSLFVGYFAARPWLGYVASPAELEVGRGLGAALLLVEGTPEPPTWVAGLEELGAVPSRDRFPGLGPVVYRLYRLPGAG